MTISQSHPTFTISVIITTFNRIKVLERAILSVQEQTQPADEIIVIDDGSTDGTDRLIATKYPDIKYVWQENSGISQARNQGILRSTNDWIAFLDSDDAWLPKKIENQAKALQTTVDYLICHTNEIWIRNGKRVNPMKKHEKFGGHIFQKCLPLCIISPSSVIIHRTIFDRFGTFDESLPVCEDYDLWLRICAFIPVLFLREPQIMKYGGHRDQLSRKYWGMDRFRIIALEKIINSPDLSADKKRSALIMILDKIGIFINGARKRGNDQDVNIFVDKRNYYQNLFIR
jgi:glycosyltransferase involved in cell wall biosynthesis